MRSSSSLAAQLAQQIAQVNRIGQRTVVAIAGPPAAGKSTLASEVVEAFGDRAAVLGLDGFHFDDEVLNQRGHRARKGAPHTFDVSGYRALLQRVRQEPTAQVAAPIFDRDQELSRAAATIIEPHHTVVVTEGNWLLLDQPPWDELRPLFDLTVFLRVSEQTIGDRIQQRWLGHGFDQAEAARRWIENDLPNARLALTESGGADLVYENDGDS